MLETGWRGGDSETGSGRSRVARRSLAPSPTSLAVINTYIRVCVLIFEQRRLGHGAHVLVRATARQKEEFRASRGEEPELRTPVQCSAPGPSPTRPIAPGLTSGCQSLSAGAARCCWWQRPLEKGGKRATRDENRRVACSSPPTATAHVAPLCLPSAG